MIFATRFLAVSRVLSLTRGSVVGGDDRHHAWLSKPAFFPFTGQKKGASGKRANLNQTGQGCKASKKDPHNRPKRRAHVKQAMSSSITEHDTEEHDKTESIHANDNNEDNNTHELLDEETKISDSSDGIIIEEEKWDNNTDDKIVGDDETSVKHVIFSATRRIRMRASMKRRNLY